MSNPGTDLWCEQQSTVQLVPNPSALIACYMCACLLRRYDNWGQVLRIEELQLKVPVRVELDLPVDYDTKEAHNKLLAPAKRDPHQEASIKQLISDRTNTLSRKERMWLDRRVRAVVNALMQDLAPRAAAAEQKMLLNERLRRQQLQQQQQQRGVKQHAPAAAAAAAGQPIASAGGSGEFQVPRTNSNGSGKLQFQQRPQARTHATTSQGKRVHWAAAVQSAYNALKQKLVSIRQEAQHVQPGDYDAVAAAGHRFRSSVKQLQQQAQQMENLLVTLHDKVLQRQQQRAHGAPATAAAGAGGGNAAVGVRRTGSGGVLVGPGAAAGAAAAGLPQAGSSAGGGGGGSSVMMQQGGLQPGLIPQPSPPSAAAAAATGGGGLPPQQQQVSAGFMVPLAPLAGGGSNAAQQGGMQPAAPVAPPPAAQQIEVIDLLDD